MPDPSPPTLTRSIGLIGAIGFGLGAMVGTGVFVYTGVAAGMAGPAMLVSLALAGFAAACNGLSSAQLASVMPESGGTYVYAGRKLSPWLGFLAGWLFLAAKTTSAAATALGFGAYVGGALGISPLIIALSLVAAVTILNLLHVARAGVVNLALVGVSIASLAAFVATGLPRVDVSRLKPFAPLGAGGILSAAALLFVAYAGYGRIATLGEEVREPRRTIPIAVVVALAGAALLYLLVSFVALGTIGWTAFGEAARAGAPLQAAAASPWVRWALAAGAGTALGGVFLNLMLGLSRMSFAMARGGDLPSPLSRVNAASSPYASVLFVGITVAGLVAARDVVVLVSISAFTILVYYGLTNLSSLRLTRAERMIHPVVPVLGLICCLALAASVPWRSLAIGATVLAAGAFWRLVWRLRRPDRPAAVAGD